MQLSNFPSIPASQPVVAYAPPEADTSSLLPSASNDTPFAQLLPSPAPANPGKPSTPPDKKPDTPKEARDESKVPIYYSWLTDLSQQNVPTAANTPKVAEATGMTGGTAASAQALGAQGLPVGAANISAGKNIVPSLPAPVIGKAAEPLPPKLPTASAAPAIPAPRTSGAPAPVSIPGKATTPVPWSGPGSASNLSASEASDGASKAAPTGANPATDAVNLIKAASHLGAAGMGAAEKIAGQASNGGGAPVAASKAADKKILSSDGKQVTDSDPSVGIAVAKVAPAMPTSAQTDRQPTAMMAAAPVSTVSASSGANPGDTQGAVSQQGVAQRAVDAALSAAETVNSGSHQAFNMQFSVGNADLSLRVELRNGEIHTTFRTDSADLRLDLAHEWQSSNPGSGNGSLRLAEPVFTSSNSQSSLAGENASQQRGGQGRSDSSQAPAGGMHPGAFSASTSDEADTPARAQAVHSTSLHLQAFA